MESFITFKEEYIPYDQLCQVPHNELIEQNEATSNESSPTGTLPPMDEYKGPLDFELLLDGATSSKNSWVYSILLHKVFMDINKILLVQFKINSFTPGLRVRALPVYSLVDVRQKPVNRCTVHSVLDDPERLAHREHNLCKCNEYNWVGHVVQSTHSDARYDYDLQSGRHSVTTPLDAVQPGCDTVTVPYFFTCMTSCVSGMNRNAINLIFTLENMSGEVIGRQTLAVKICSCPKRDERREEKEERINREDAIREGKEIPTLLGKRKRDKSINNKNKKQISSENITPLDNRNISSPPSESIQEQLTNLKEELSELKDNLKEELSEIKNLLQRTYENTLFPTETIKHE
uniref:p53 DNA-binding domain-containing protein n=1 Tax=Clastoptera arizonana TaxID=38151 RepID=A0A1B6DHV5_9HEMI